MIDLEQESILHCARLRRERIAALRRRRVIAELRRQGSARFVGPFSLGGILVDARDGGSVAAVHPNALRC